MKRLFAFLLLTAWAFGQATATPAQTPQPEEGGWWQHKPKPQPLTLWGITMDAPPPVFPICGDDPWSETQTCVRKRGRGRADEIYNLISPKGTSYAHITLDHDTVAGLSIDLGIDDYSLVLEALTRKLGKPSHQSLIMENGFGASWQAYIDQCLTVDGSLVRLRKHFADSSERNLTVLHPEAVKQLLEKPPIKEP